MKYLKKSEMILPVTEVYAYRYDMGKGKTVLRSKCAADVAFSGIQAFFSAVGDYEYYDGTDGAEELKTVYTQYGADLDIHYKQPAEEVQPDGSITTPAAYYDIEVLRDPSLDAAVRTLQADNVVLSSRAESAEKELTATQLALTEQYEENLTLSQEITAAQIALTELYETITAMEESRQTEPPIEPEFTNGGEAVVPEEITIEQNKEV